MFPLWLIIKLLILLWPIVTRQNEIFSLSTESEGKLLTRRGDKNGSDNWRNYRGGVHACSCFWRKIGFTLGPSVPGVPGRPRGPCRPWGPAAPLSPGNPRSPCTVTEGQSAWRWIAQTSGDMKWSVSAYSGPSGTRGSSLSRDTLEGENEKLHLRCDHSSGRCDKVMPVNLYYGCHGAFCRTIMEIWHSWIF